MRIELNIISVAIEIENNFIQIQKTLGYLGPNVGTKIMNTLICSKYWYEIRIKKLI